MTRFWVWAGAWLADMALLSASGPIGANPYGFAAGYAIGFGLMALMVRDFPAGWPRKTGLAVVCLLGIVSRLMFWSFPADDDVYRYVWEGHLQAVGFNPYLHAPADPALDAAAADLPGVRQSVNQPHLPAAYPPLALLAFRALNALGADVRVYKAAFLLADIGLILLLAGLAGARGVPVSRLLYYAANPLAIVYVAGEAHLDVLQALPLAAALWCWARKKEGWGFFWLGTAVMVKYLAGIVFFAFVGRANWRKALLAGLPLVLFLPFAEAGRSLFGSLVRFGTEMHFNDGVTSLLRLFFGSGAVGTAIGLAVTGTALILLVEPDPFRSAFYLAGWLLLLLPTLHPWYLLLVLPFLVLFPSPAWLYLAASAAWTFPVLGVEWRTGVFQEIHWVKWLVYGPFLGLLVWSWRRDSRPGDLRSFPPVSTLSVVVPCLNEADRIRHCLASVADQDGVAEVIVVDGGSADGTRALAAAAGARVMAAGGGRGGQIKAGVDAATGDVVLVLHADSALKAGACSRVLARLNAGPASPGGAMGMSFDWEGPSTAVIRTLNAFRARWLGISFGDQAQFVRSAALKRMGGYPGLQLMEDVELSLRLKQLGKPIYIQNGVTVSGRRWEGEGFFGKTLLVVRLTLGYLARRRWLGREWGTRELYRRYYRRHLQNDQG